MRLNRFLIFFIFSFRLCAQTTLSGNIGGMTFEKEGNPYIISETVIIYETVVVFPFWMVTVSDMM